MKRPIALLAGALVAAGLIVAPAPPSSADTTTITGDRWSMTLSIMDTNWSELFSTNFLLCKDLNIQLTVSAPDGWPWSLEGQVTGAGSIVSLESFAISGIGPKWTPIPITGVSMCQHFNTAVAPPDHQYLATGLAKVPDSLQPALPFEVPFTIDPMNCSVQWRSHELRNGVSAFPGEVVARTNDGFSRPGPAGTVTVDRLEGSTWLKAGETTSASDGSFVVTTDRVLATGSYIRFQYTGNYWCAAHPGMPVEVWAPFIALPMPTPIPVVTTPPPVVVNQPTARVTIKAVSARSKLRVDVNPNMGSKYWTFQVQRKNTDGTWKALKTYRTWGSTEKRTLNLRKGTYRVWVNPKFGHLGAMSATEVRLTR